MKRVEEAPIGCLLAVTLIITTFNFTHGLECVSCAYFKIGNLEMGDANCKYGKSLPVKECTENYIVPGSAVVPSSQKIRLGDIRQSLLTANRELTDEKPDYYYTCERIEGVLSVNELPMSIMSRGCTINDKKKPVCKPGNQEELDLLSNIIPITAGADVKLDVDHFQACLCFEDQCNSGGKLSGNNLVWITSALLVVALNLMKI